MFKGKDFLFLGFKEGKILGIALEIANTAFADAKKQDTLTTLNRVRKNPEAYLSTAATGNTIQTYENKLYWILLVENKS